MTASSPLLVFFVLQSMGEEMINAAKAAAGT